MLVNNTCADCGKKFSALAASWWCDDCRKNHLHGRVRKQKLKTNADRIRAMSDEELAK